MCAAVPPFSLSPKSPLVHKMLTFSSVLHPRCLNALPVLPYGDLPAGSLSLGYCQLFVFSLGPTLRRHCCNSFCLIRLVSMFCILGCLKQNSSIRKLRPKATVYFAVVKVCTAVSISLFSACKLEFFQALTNSLLSLF